MYLRKDQVPIFVVFLVFLLIYAIHFYRIGNLEFLAYIGITLIFLVLVLVTNPKVKYPNSILWGLTFWALLHFSGGGLRLDGSKLYDVVLLPLSDTYPIFRFDQLVHTIGFGIATLLMYHLIKPLLKPNIKSWVRLSIVVVMAGTGVGALNEIIEFTATIISPENGVGGYVNNALDLVFNLIGALFAMIYIQYKERVQIKA